LVGPGAKQVEFIPPSTPTEKRVAEIFASVLDIGQPGIHDDFFQLGGD
jgi:hypothetical protein